MAILFVELLLIRWIPANVIYVGYFSNFILIASFLGIGLGILFGRAWGSSAVSPFALLLFGVVVLVLRAQLNIRIDPEDQIFFGLEYSNSADTNFLVLPLVMLLVVGLMATLALPLGGLLRSMPPLRAYAVDIAGSLAGIAGFGILSALGFEPIAWFAVAAVLLSVLALARGITVWSAVSAAAMVGVLVLIGAEAARLDIWSPYYRVSTYDRAELKVSARPGSADLPAYVHVNGIGLEALVAPDDVAGTVLHRRIYEWLPGPNVRPRSRHRGRHRERRGSRARARQPARRRGRDRSGDRADRTGFPARTPVQRSAGHRPRRRRAGVPPARHRDSTT